MTTTPGEACQLTVLIPVYNERNTVVQVLDTVRTALASLSHETIVVDDCSSDGTREILAAWFAEHGDKLPNYRLLLHDRNRGKGAAIKSGVDVARGRFFLVQDADLEYDPAEVPGLLAVASEGGPRVVYGSRFLGSIDRMPRAHLVANRFFNVVLRRLYRVQVTDMHTCYKLLPTDLLRGIRLRSEGFGYATEMISKLLRLGVPITEVPVSFTGRTVNEGKKIGALDGVECLVTLVAYRLAPRRRLGVARGLAGGIGDRPAAPPPIADTELRGHVHRMRAAGDEVRTSSVAS